MENALYMADSYLKEFEATVESAKDDKYIVLSQSAFYPQGGGQLGFHREQPLVGHARVLHDLLIFSREVALLLDRLYYGQLLQLL